MNAEHARTQIKKTDKERAPRAKVSKEARPVVPEDEDPKEAEPNGKAKQTVVKETKGRIKSTTKKTRKPTAKKTASKSPEFERTPSPRPSPRPSDPAQLPPSSSGMGATPINVVIPIMVHDSPDKEKNEAKKVVSSKPSKSSASKAGKSPIKGASAHMTKEVHERTLDLINKIVDDVNRVTETEVTSLLNQTGQTNDVNRTNEDDKAKEKAGTEKEGENIDSPVQEGSCNVENSTSPVINEEPEQQETISDLETPVSQQEVDNMFKHFLSMLEEVAEVITRPYYNWCRMRSEVTFRNLLPSYSENKHMTNLVAMEDEIFDLAKTDCVPIALARARLVDDNARLIALTKALNETQGESTVVKKKLVERFEKMKEDLITDISRLEEETNKHFNDCFLKPEDYQSKPIYEVGESSKWTGHPTSPSGKSPSKSIPHTNSKETNIAGQEEPKIAMSVHSQFPEKNQEVDHLSGNIKGLIDNAVDISMSKWHAVTESRTATLNSELLESVKARVESSTVPLLEMMQVIAAQIEK
ncbi:uncharacterized protein LOC124913262 [Impatiens glandulifera]|uniref:uncharacterized protein LOC124913262 n=1 Tax=Impatiens glandulifera TaxID=253017 RepID=UPI001FB1314E|nr:uncharacterized protein LOC124913262 [Impatiens glandulifera]